MTSDGETSKLPAIAGLIGYYIMIVMTLLAHEVPLPAGTAPYWK